jgi:hypothetical protein
LDTQETATWFKQDKATSGEKFRYPTLASLLLAPIVGALINFPDNKWRLQSGKMIAIEIASWRLKTVILYEEWIPTWRPSPPPSNDWFGIDPFESCLRWR